LAALGRSAARWRVGVAIAMPVWLVLALATTDPAVTDPAVTDRLAPVALVPRVIVRADTRSLTPAAGPACHTSSRVACYQPFQLRRAYDLEPLYARGITGRGTTIAIIDPFGSPTIAQDLAHFDTAFGLPAPPSFRVLTPEGPIPAYRPGAKDRYAWASETSLDVEWAHAIAPRASIVLVETPTDEVEGTSGFPDIVAAERYVLAHHLAEVISQSFGATEPTFANAAAVFSLRGAYVTAKADAVTVLASSGDLGATDYEDNAVDIYPRRVTSWPASDPLVTAVGGTRLDLSGSGAQLAAAVAWNDTYSSSPPVPEASGGGTSVFFARPSYQDAVAASTGAHRGVPDVAMSAACSGPVDVYVGVGGAAVPMGWVRVCGTSEAAPLFAGVVALADQLAGRALGFLNPSLYGLLSTTHSGIVAVTSGNNTVAFTSRGHRVTVQGFDARRGYSLVTGVGTIDAATFVVALVAESKRLGG
jgi:subtilase family serine protease